MLVAYQYIAAYQNVGQVHNGSKKLVGNVKMFVGIY